MAINQVSLDDDGRGERQEKKQKRQNGLAEHLLQLSRYSAVLYLWTFKLGKGCKRGPG